MASYDIDFLMDRERWEPLAKAIADDLPGEWTLYITRPVVEIEPKMESLGAIIQVFDPTPPKYGAAFPVADGFVEDVGVDVAALALSGMFLRHVGQRL